MGPESNAPVQSCYCNTDTKPNCAGFCVCNEYGFHCPKLSRFLQEAQKYRDGALSLWMLITILLLTSSSLAFYQWLSLLKKKKVPRKLTKSRELMGKDYDRNWSDFTQFNYMTYRYVCVCERERDWALGKITPNFFLNLLNLNICEKSAGEWYISELTEDLQGKQKYLKNIKLFFWLVTVLVLMRCWECIHGSI